MIQHAVYILLALVVAFDHDITLPELVPCFGMKIYQAIPAFQFGINGQTFSFIQWIIMVRRCNGGTGNGKVISLASLYFFAEFHQVHVVVPHFMDYSWLLSVRFRK